MHLSEGGGGGKRPEKRNMSCISEDWYGMAWQYVIYGLWDTKGHAILPR